MRGGIAVSEAPEATAPVPDVKKRRSVFARAVQMELPKEGKAVLNQLRKTYANEFKVAWANWNKLAMDLDWCKLYPKEKRLQSKTTDELDIVWDLMPLDVGPVYRELSGSLYFSMPKLAKQRLGGNMGASFCERMNSIAKDVLDEGNSLLLDAEVEAMVVLRANRRFMKMCHGPWLCEIRLYAELHGLNLVPP